MATGVHLSISLWTVGMYSIVLRYRYYQFRPSRLLIAGTTLCFVLEVVVGFFLGGVFSHWQANPPYECPDGRSEVDWPEPWYIAVGVIVFFVFPWGSIISAWVPIWRKSPLLWWRCSLVFISTSWITSIVQNEVVMRTNHGYDKEFAEQVMEWGMGQIVAILFVTGQILEIFKYLRTGAYRSETQNCHSNYG